MMNYLAIDESHIQIEFGILGEVTSFQTYPSGELESVKLGGQNMVMTHAGELIPAFTQTNRRKNKPSIEFHKNGMIKAVSLEEQTEVETPIGSLPAEYVTFYPEGQLHRLFISDGQISGFWSEEEEMEYNIALSFELDFAAFSAHLNGICFYKDGAIKSITLYPGELVTVTAPSGTIETGIGFSLFESGKLESVEPNSPVLVPTEIGNFSAYDENAIGVNADSNSLIFDETGRVTALKTSGNRILVQTEKGGFLVLEPEERQHPLHDDQKIKVAMEIQFDFCLDTVIITNNQSHVFPMKTTRFTIQEIDTGFIGCSPADCASCSLCHSKSTSMKSES